MNRIPSIGPADADKASEYSFKPSMAGAVQIFRLEADRLHWNMGSRSGDIPYRAIRRIRLSFRPLSMATHRFIAEIWSDVAPKLTIASTSWRSMVEYERQDARYAAFVRALSRRIADAGGDTRFVTGSPPLLYWPGVALGAVLAVGLPWMLIVTARTESWGAVAIVAALLALFVWQMGALFWRNRPGSYAPDNVPPAVLPRGGRR